MLRLGLRDAQLAAFHDLLQTHHWIDVRLELLDLDHQHIADIGNRLLGGQVNVDADAEVTRGLDLDLLDLEHGLQLDSDSPNEGALFADRMIRVKYRVINPEGTISYAPNVFTGPLTKVERTGAILKVEAQGKEVFGLTEAWNTKTFKEDTRVTTAIRWILSNMMGEPDKFIKIPNLSRKLPRKVSVGGDKLPWVVAKQLARSIGYQLYYDGDGVVRMRKDPGGKPVFWFRTGGALKTEPEAGFDIDNVVNAVEVWGKKPGKKDRKGKKRPHAKVVAPRNHPLSPWKLGRNNGPRFLPVVIEDDSIRTDKAARQRGNAALKRGLLESVEVACDALPIPHLEELDIVGIDAPSFSTKFKLRQFAIPLTASGDSSIGYVRNVRPDYRRTLVAPKRKPRKKNRKRSRDQ